MQTRAAALAPLLVALLVGADQEVDCSAMKTKQLRQWLAARGLSCSGCAEKSDFVNMCEANKAAPLVESKLPEPELKDDGSQGDRTARDNVYSLRINDVPVGSTLAWKAFASFTTTFAAANPNVPGAAFADATRGPAVFGDGQEYPGNDNAVFLVGDDDGDGVVTIECLFGDEITFKRKTGFPAFHMALGRARRAE